MDRRVAAVLLAVIALSTLGRTSVAESVTIDLSDTPKIISSDATSPHTTGTDTGAPVREAESISAQSRKARSGGQQYTFQAEVNRLMDILINSLYSNKDIFLRELISNASDALDKIRFLSLTDKSVLGEGDNSKLEIKIHLDKDNRVLYIRDRGLGMTKDDLIKNLGTIAKSGTSGFLEAMQKGGDVNLIGQFGVGFYSVYLVADYVEVVSKHNDDAQYIWASGADGSFTIEEDTENEPLGRGTLLKIHLKEEAQEYADEAKLKELVEKYSEFINFPIYLLTEKEVDVPVEDSEDKEEKTDDKEDDEDAKEDDDADDAVEDEAEEEEMEKKTRKEKRSEWDLLNDNKAIWLRKPSEVTDEEYQKFYKAISKDYADALTWAHFRAEGDVEFKSVLFIPKNAPYDFYDKYYEKKASSLKLYVRRVFISDDVDELLPRYLSFIRGLVDSDTLPLNVSREMLSTLSALKTIKKKLVRKVLDMIRKLAEDEEKCKKHDKKGDKAADDEEEEIEKPSDAECKAYPDFWKAFGRSIKLGVIEDATNRNRLAKLLRFHTSKSPDKLTSLDEYIGRMKDGQKDIYFLAGTSQEEVASSPFLERLLAKGYEVIYFTDVLDEYVMQHMLDYDGKKFSNASKEDLKMSDKDEKEKAKDKELKEEFKPLTKWWKTVLDSKVSSVRVSNRLATTPCVVVTPKYGQSANMERIARAQAFGKAQPPGGSAAKVFEINPRHPLIRSLKEKVGADEADEVAKAMAKLLFDTALLESGYVPEDIKDFSKRVYGVVGAQIGTDGPLDVDAEEADAEEDGTSEASKASDENTSEDEEDGDGKDEL